MIKRTVAAATAAVAASLFTFGHAWAQEPSQFVVTENAQAIANITDPEDNSCHPAVVSADAPRTVYWVNKTQYFATLYIRAADGPECGGTVLNRLRPGAVGAAPATLQGTVVDVRFSAYQ